ncbi:MAG: HlyD family secretion protein [Deltaproteobacteria bacterium]|nr:MAG: HlyD family secretion protein [Deltaproteobacteria bacterium]
METPKLSTRLIVTGTLIVLAVVVTTLLYYRSVNRPWTRDGQVRAKIIEIASQVSGQVIKVAVIDNQRVKKGDLLFQIDPKDYELQVKDAEAVIEQREAQLKLAESEKDRILEALKTNAVSRALADKAVASVNVARANLNRSKISLETAKLKLSWTSIYAPGDGYVTNLELKEGDYSNTGSAILAFVDSNSYWVYGYFKETQLKHIKPGDRAVVTLMSHRDKPIEGVVNSIGRAISTPGTANISELVPEISATFDWVRLAQRVPVRIELKKVPEGVDLIVGTTASVAVIPDKSN